MSTEYVAVHRSEYENMCERIDLYRRQLGGTNAALARARQQVRDLTADRDRLQDDVARYHARHVEDKERIEQLEQLCRDLWRFRYSFSWGKLEKHMDALGLLEVEQ